MGKLRTEYDSFAIKVHAVLSFPSLSVSLHRVWQSQVRILIRIQGDWKMCACVYERVSMCVFFFLSILQVSLSFLSKCYKLQLLQLGSNYVLFGAQKAHFNVHYTEQMQKEKAREKENGKVARKTCW